MRKRTIKLLLWLACCSAFPAALSAQAGYSTGLNKSVINLPCNQNCVNVPLRIPHLKTTADYTVSSVPYTPYAYVTAGGNEVTSIYDDDLYSEEIPLPFSFCFYDSLFTSLVIGSNGLMTFDPANAICHNSWHVTQPIPNAQGRICDNTTTHYYPKASIMAAYFDFDAAVGASPPDRKIEWRVEGTAPFRSFIVSFYHIGTYNNDACALVTPNTFQMVIYESTGIVEIYLEQKICNATSNLGRGIMGIQNWNRDKALAVPGKNNTVWNESGTAYRFLPSGPVSRFVKSEVYELNGTFIATGDTTTTEQGLLDISFPGFCVPASTGEYVVRTVFSGCDISTNEIVILDTITINKTNSLNATVTTTSTSCGLTGTGTATVSIPVGVGTAPYTFALAPLGISKTVSIGTTLFDGLTEGNYTVTVTDASGVCVSPLPFIITNTGVMDISLTSLNTTCAGAANGSITIDPPNGTPLIEYSINNGPFGTNNIFSNLAANTYIINVRDGAGCTATNIPVTISPGPAITMTTAVTPTTCPGVNNGSITITGSTGTAPFVYSINGGAYQANPVFSNLAPAMYFISLRDAGGCTILFEQVTVTQGNTPLTGQVAVTPTSCSGAMNGSIAVTPTSGTGPYEFSIDNGANWQTSNLFNGLPAGNYTMLIREGGACISNGIPAIVSTGPALTATAAAAPTACIGVDNGSITVTPDPLFTGPFEYALDGNAFQTGNVFTNVAAGNHTVVVRNSSGCLSGNINITVPAGLTLLANAISTAVTCNGLADGSISVTPANGSAPYSYSLNGGPGQASGLFNGLTAGSYSIRVTDAFGCVSLAIPVTVIQPDVLSALSPVRTAVTCNGAADGSIAAFPTGGTAPYSYSLDNINFQPGNTFNVAQGVYNLYIRDVNGCTINFTNLTIAQPPALSGTIVSTTNATCEGGDNGTIQVAASGGTTAYQYSADGINFQSSNLLNVRAGTYQVTIRDANNCTFSIPGVVVGLTDNLTLSAVNPAPICEGSSVQLEVTSNATGYTWTPATGGLTNLFISNPVASPAVTTTYTVIATLGNCSRPIDVTVTVLPAPQADAGSDGEICFGQDFRLQGTGGISYNWSPAIYLDNNSLAAPFVIQPEKSVTYSLIVTDANNCSSLQPDHVTVNVTPPIKINISPLDTAVYAGAQYQLVATSAGTDYLWSPAAGLSNSRIPDPVVTAPVTGTEIIYRVIATTAAGCRGEGTATVRVYSGPDIYMATAFTPNNDGKNDLFIPFPVGIKQLSYFRVFNRWGQLLYSTNTLHKGWDGKFGGAEQASGVYVWMVQGVTLSGAVIKKTGTVTLIR
jgi:gliding motility-associated-like protein